MGEKKAISSSNLSSAIDKFAEVFSKYEVPQDLEDAAISLMTEARRSELKPVPVKQIGPVKLNPREMGYTGEMCPHCSSIRVVRSGTCSTCHDCQKTTGCS